MADDDLQGEKPSNASLGGLARAESLPSERRKEIASAAAAARWSKPVEVGPVLKVLCGSPDRPLRIGDIEIPCYVLEDGTRVLSQRGVVGGLGMKYGSRVDGADRLTGFLSGKSIYDSVSSDLMALIGNPIKFRGSGGITYGYPATILADLCDAVLTARLKKTLQRQQEHIAERCEILMRGFARVGIIALVDEATGYQEQREQDELQQLLSIYLSPYKLKWAKRFPDEFYKQLYRLMGWPKPEGVARSPYVGKLTNKYVYRLLPPGVLEELRTRNPPDPETGRRTNHHHQYLSVDIGQPDLRDHFSRLMPVMQLSTDISDFDTKVDIVFAARLAQLSEFHQSAEGQAVLDLEHPAHMDLDAEGAAPTSPKFA